MSPFTNPPQSLTAGEFLAHLEEITGAYKVKTSIITFYSRIWSQAFDLKFSKGQWVFGYSPYWRALLEAKLQTSEYYPISCVVRTFTDEKHKRKAPNGKTVLIPTKELRMFFLPAPGQVIKLTPEECFACHHTDSQTGEPLPLEQDVKFL